MPTKVGEYKGNKTITLEWEENSKYPFSFGLGKAKLILKHIAQIEEFVAQNDKPREGRSE